MIYSIDFSGMQTQMLRLYYNHKLLNFLGIYYYLKHDSLNLMIVLIEKILAEVLIYCQETKLGSDAATFLFYQFLSRSAKTLKNLHTFTTRKT
jgi:NADH:ubiquinone oxidoreductase subunit 4 (subunit M)